MSAGHSSLKPKSIAGVIYINDYCYVCITCRSSNEIQFVWLSNTRITRVSADISIKPNGVSWRVEEPASGRKCTKSRRRTSLTFSGLTRMMMMFLVRSRMGVCTSVHFVVVGGAADDWCRTGGFMTQPTAILPEGPPYKLITTCVIAYALHSQLLF